MKLLFSLTTSVVFVVFAVMARANTYQLDDGTAELAYGNSNGGDFIALNEFPVTAGNNLITSISIAWGDPNNPDPSLLNLSYTAVLWSDQSGVGDPTGASFLAMIPGNVITTEGTNTFLTSTFASPILVPTANFFVGFILTQGANQAPGSVDTSIFNTGRSFFATNLAGAGNINNLNLNPGGVQIFDPIWMIRADAVPEPSSTTFLVVAGIAGLIVWRRQSTKNGALRTAAGRS